LTGRRYLSIKRVLSHCFALHVWSRRPSNAEDKRGSGGHIDISQKVAGEGRERAEEKGGRVRELLRKKKDAVQ